MMLSNASSRLPLPISTLQNADSRKLRFAKEDSAPPKPPSFILPREQIAREVRLRAHEVGLPAMVKQVFGAVAWHYDKWRDQLMVRLEPPTNHTMDLSEIAWLHELEAVKSVDELANLEAIRNLAEPQKQQEVAKRRNLLQEFLVKLGEPAALEAKTPGKPLLDTVFEKVFSPFMTGSGKRFSEIVFSVGARADCCGLQRHKSGMDPTPCCGCDVGTALTGKLESKASKQD